MVEIHECLVVGARGVGEAEEELSRVLTQLLEARQHALGQELDGQLGWPVSSVARIDTDSTVFIYL